MGSSKRGFASMDPEKQREIARKGGQSVPVEKRSFSQNPELAARAGRKGGQSVDLRIPTKPAMHSNLKPATYSDLKPAGVPI
jgi:general stress protein YciG